MKRFYWNVDTQKDFMNEDGKLYVPDAEGIKGNLKKLIKNIRSQEDYLLVHTADEHFENSEELSDNPNFINTFPPHCMVSTEGYEQIEETKMIDSGKTFRWYEDNNLNNFTLDNNEYLLTKDKFNVFEGNPIAKEFVQHIKDNGYTDVGVFGVSTNVCVYHAVEYLKKHFYVIIYNECVKGLPNLDDPIPQWAKEKNIIILP